MIQKAGFVIDPQLLLNAYAAGIFPMAESADDDTVFWVRPERRGILPLDAFHIPRRLARTVRQGRFAITHDSDFAAVIDGCAMPMEGRTSTWINAPIRQTYARLFELGHCHTVEAWQDGRLVGGLYGVSLGRAFFGESMFSRVRDASKVCLVALVERLKQRGFVLLDAQFTTGHLKTFGAIDVPRRRYEKLLEAALEGEPARFN